MSERKLKIKLLKLYELLLRETDEEHPISRRELCRRLNLMGIPSNVRTLSRDIRLICSEGYEIMTLRKGREKYYYIADHILSVPEIRIILDALQAASFVTPKKTGELMDKIASFAGSHKAELLKRNVVRFDTRKHTNERVFYTVDCIEEAISRKKKITFHYFHLNEKAGWKYVEAESGKQKRYCVDPVALIFHEDNYYLMAYSSRHPESTANYRIDRMDAVEMVRNSRISREAESRIRDAASYTSRVFRMFGGRQERVVLQFEDSLIDPFLDKFGEHTPIRRVDEQFCRASVHVQVSPTFFGWLSQFGSRIRILSPESVAAQYREHIRSILETF